MCEHTNTHVYSLSPLFYVSPYVKLLTNFDFVRFRDSRIIYLREQERPGLVMKVIIILFGPISKILVFTFFYTFFVFHVTRDLVFIITLEEVRHI